MPVRKLGLLRRMKIKHEHEDTEMSGQNKRRKNERKKEREGEFCRHVKAKAETRPRQGCAELSK